MYLDEDEYLRSLKREDSYHFSVPFEYIKKNYGNDNYDTAVTNMNVDVNWSDTEIGYIITHNVPEMDLIDPNESNGDEDSFYEYGVEDIVLEKLESLGIGAEALVWGTGTP